jgi:hypothetical protein
MINFQFDPEETVEWIGVDSLSLRIAVRRIMALPKERRRLVALYRGAGKEPAFFGASHIEWLAALPEFEAN